jgi:hypothetical protein
MAIGEDNPNQLELDINSSNDLTNSIGTIYIDDTWLNNSTITIPSNGYINTANNITWASTDYSITGSYGYTGANVVLNENGMEIKEGGDIKIGGKSLTEAIEKIEERLGILHPNPELEDRWEQLKQLRKQYQELEKDLLEKEKMLKILKES